MKRLFTLILLAFLLPAALRAQIEPFEYRLVKDTQFTLAEYAASSGSPEGPRQVFSVKKGTVVTVLNRSAATPWLRIRLGDGSIGWVSPEAFGGKLPAAFSALPAYGVDYGSIYRFPSGIGGLMGHDRATVESLIGEPDAVAGNGFTTKGGLTCSYYARVGCESMDDDHIYTGIYVFYDKDGVAASEYTYHDFCITGQYSGMKVISVFPPVGAREGVYQFGEYTDRSYHDRYRRSGTFAAPEVTPADVEAARVAPVVHAREGMSYEAPKTSLGERLGDVVDFLEDYYPPWPWIDGDTFKSALVRILLFLAVFILGGKLVMDKMTSYNFRTRYILFIILLLAFFPWPQYFFTEMWEWNFWGWTGFVVGAFFLAFGLPNVIGSIKDEGWVKCRKCRRWVMPSEILKTVRRNPSNDKPKPDGSFTRVLVETGEPKDSVERNGEDTKSVRKVKKTYVQPSRMLIHFDRDTVCRCPRCNGTLHVTGVETEEVRGPIIWTYDTDTVKSYREKEITRTPDGRTVEEHTSEPKEEKSSHTDLIHIDYDNYGPYYKRYCAGDEDALGEYYVKYWKW